MTEFFERRFPNAAAAEMRKKLSAYPRLTELPLSGGFNIITPAGVTVARFIPTPEITLCYFSRRFFLEATE